MEATVLEVLTQPNPPLNLTRQKGGRLTQNPKYIAMDPYEVSTSIWEDFNYENVVAALEHLLKHGPVKSIIADNVDDSQKDIELEEDMDRLCDHWITKVVYQPLKYGTTQTLRQLGMVEIQSSFRPKGARLKDPVEESSLFPDWYLYQRTDPKTPLVVGDSKCSSKWRSNIDESPNSGNDWLWPIRQIGSYCKHSGTSYAFIITPEELVAVRFYTVQVNKDTRVEFKSIPWDAQGPNELTINLAVWALAMFALNEGHRAMRDRSETLPLNIWWEDRNAEGLVSYEHHLSGRKVMVLPSGGEARQRPNSIPDFQTQDKNSNSLTERASGRKSKRQTPNSIPSSQLQKGRSNSSIRRVEQRRSGRERKSRRNVRRGL